MGIKKFKPTTPSLRKMAVMTSEGLAPNKPLKSLTAKKTKTAGRNSYGRITSRRRGGGAKQRYRVIDFKRNKVDRITKKRQQRILSRMLDSQKSLTQKDYSNN